jgi:hypothetical protein
MTPSASGFGEKGVSDIGSTAEYDHLRFFDAVAVGHP